MVYQKNNKSQEINNKCKHTNASYVEVKNARNLKLWPIIGELSCLTHRLSNLLHIIIRPFTNHLRSNLLDTTDFLNNLQKRVPANTSLASFDIVALYSDIPHDLGIKTIQCWLDRYPETLKGRYLTNLFWTE